MRRWIASDPRHAAAFELATESWQASGNLPAHIGTATVREAASRILTWRLALGAVVACAMVVVIYQLRDKSISTGAGEQRILALGDGSHVTLNARSAVKLQFSAAQRQLVLLRGEAYFQVAKDPARPFIVVAGSRTVRALGTAFAVRCEDAAGGSFSVTLVEGQVSVQGSVASEPAVTRPSMRRATPAGSNAAVEVRQRTAAEVEVLKPGERLRFMGNDRAVLDRPALERVMAWQRGLLIFDGTTLSDAAAEFNRYGTVHLTIHGDAGNLPIGGVFRIGDAANFAQSMARAYQLRLRQRGEEIDIER